jgi:hypothetical protein
VGLGMKERYAVLGEMAKPYRRGDKKAKTKMLDELIELTGYNRKYATHVIWNWGRRKEIRDGEGLIIAEAGKGRRKQKARKKKYDGAVVAALIKVWIVYDCICGKRLQAVLEGQMEVLRKCRMFGFAEGVWEKLGQIKAATIDRVLKGERKKVELKGRSYTKPGTLVKHRIPIRRGSDWDEKKPGFVEVDLVGHEGGNARGDFAFSLDVTDVATGWTEPYGLKNKAQKWTFEGLLEVRNRLPMELLGIDSDNGSEFINNHLWRYCEAEGIEFTRSRPNRKNDNCYIEQKNNSVVRRYAGYYRYDTEEEVAKLNELYGQVRLQVNFFLPSMKLLEKTRVGSKIVKKYDRPKTPYQRLRESGILSQEALDKLEREFQSLNPVAIQRKIVTLQDSLEKMVLRKQRLSEASQKRKAL